MYIMCAQLYFMQIKVKKLLQIEKFRYTAQLTLINLNKPSTLVKIKLVDISDGKHKQLVVSTELIAHHFKQEV